ncbi:hypothetical protein [Streptomyces niveus]
MEQLSVRALALLLAGALVVVLIVRAPTLGFALVGAAAVVAVLDQLLDRG